MAEITMTGYVQDWNKNTPQHPAWGMKVDEAHGKKGEERVYTNYTVKVSKQSNIDLTSFRKGDRVKVRGQLVSEAREWEGKKLKNLVIWADFVTVDDSQRPTPPVAAPAGVSDDTPF
jgi:hypothetical protein